MRSRISRWLKDKTWLRRAGLVGFAFFLAKGLLWLAVPALLALAAN